MRDSRHRRAVGANGPYLYDDEDDDTDGNADRRHVPPSRRVIEPKPSMGCCARIKDRMRQYYLYHLISFLAHYFGLAIAIMTTVTSITREKKAISVSSGVGVLAVISLVVDLYLLHHHYVNETYFPYCAAPHLLFMRKNKRVDPQPPPNETLYFTEKLLIFWQGYIFVIIPYTNLATALNRRKGAMTTWDEVILTLIIVQLCITLVAWVLFIGFYLVFIFEMLIRFFCFFCCLYRPRKNTAPVPTDDHIFASHSSDPIFYIPYEFLYENL